MKTKKKRRELMLRQPREPGNLRAGFVIKSIYLDRMAELQAKYSGFGYPRQSDIGSPVVVVM